MFGFKIMDLIKSHLSFLTFKLFLFICLNLCKVQGYASKGSIIEYCQGEVFAPKCNNQDIIIVQSAKYGHIQLGRCLDTDFGHLGCEVSELSYLDKQCSGKSECNIIIGDTMMGKDLPCSSSLLRYLEASYVCIKAYNVDQNICKTSPKVAVSSRKQYLNSQSTSKLGCGRENNPWILDAKPGQHINISMIDFNWKATRNQHLTCPVRYGYIIDVTENTVVDMCGGAGRTKHVYLSKGHQLHVVIDKHMLSEVSFLLSFQAIGCPTFTHPKNSWVKESDGVITVGCQHNTKQWKMRCIGNNWIGLVGDCTQVAKDTNVMATEDKKDTVLGLSPVVAFSLMGSVFFIILCVTVTFLVGVFCIRKPHRSQQKECYLTPSLNQQTLVRAGNYPTFRPVDARLVFPDVQNTIADNNDVHSQVTTPLYYMSENKEESSQNEPIYDAVYQNVNQHQG